MRRVTFQIVPPEDPSLVEERRYRPMFGWMVSWLERRLVREITARHGGPVRVIVESSGKAIRREFYVRDWVASIIIQ